MLLTAMIYMAMAFGGLAVLSVMILRIGTLLEACPQTAGRARMAAVTIATGFAAIGSGGVILIGALLPLMQRAAFGGLFLALGLVALCLGLGFTHAAGTLRLVLREPLEPVKTQNTRPEPEAVKAAV